MENHQIIEHCKKLYAIENWSAGYFGINSKGHVSVLPNSNHDYAIDLYELALSLRNHGLSFPVLVRFIDILQHRVEALTKAFENACTAHRYQGHYIPVYPIKVNQQKTVVEGILNTGQVGLEAGSKAELLAILGLPVQQAVICNGYKDQAYIRYALIGSAMGMDVTLVIEKPSELELIIDQVQQMNIRPQLGIRIRLASISTGNWQNSGGEKAKFGLRAGQVLRLVERLREAGLEQCLNLMHFHVGSQVANIHDIKTAMQEAVRYFSELQHLGVPIQRVDVGGGLGVDYDGSQSRQACSMNYNLAEYADNIIAAFSHYCIHNNLPHPDIVTESGRAMTAHHALLITDVIDVEKISAIPDQELLKTNLLESYHDACFNLTSAQTQYIQQQINLQQLAKAERNYLATCQSIRSKLDISIHTHLEVMNELDEKLADKVFCNFSLFQSMPDAWGINQVFPIMPIHRLHELPQRRGVIQDLTCDSDGRVNSYVDGQNNAKTMAIHDIKAGQNYYIGFFLLGAYQEILGDMHNLFGDTDAINIELDDSGYHIVEPIKGEHISDLLEYVHISPEQLKSNYRHRLEGSQLSSELKRCYESELCNALMADTYLQKS